MWNRDKIKLRLERPEVPPLVHGRYGGWQLGMAAAGERDEVYECGYATGPQWEENYPVLRAATGKVWMSANRMERESHAIHVRSAEGVVVCCGVGMGLFLYNVIQKPEVKTVFAVDRDPHVIDMIRTCAEERGWLNMHKVHFIEKDALRLSRADLSRRGCQEAVDYLYVDIWPSFANERTIPDTRHIAANLRPRMVGFWGQEVAFVHWLSKLRRPPIVDETKITLDHFDEWCLELDMVMQHRSRDYLKYCVVCWAVQRQRADITKQMMKDLEDSQP